MIRAVIFDMDGTMVDTENLFHEVNFELAQKYKAIFNEKIQKQMIGRKEDESLALFRDYFNLSVSVEDLLLTRKQMLLANLDKISAKEGLRELLDFLDSLRIKKAIATSAFRDYASAVIEEIGLQNRFEVFITGDQVKKGKPNPEIFLVAAKSLNVPVGECLVLEDAQNGVEAAYNAGMKVFAIPNNRSKNHDFSKATKILPSLFKVNQDIPRILR